MILRVPVPTGWISVAEPDGVLHRKGKISLKALPIREHPADAARWLERTALQGAPVGTKWNQKLRGDVQTTDGWPALVVQVELEHETFRQVRLIALYKFLDYASAAIVRAEPEEFAREREAILEILQRATPDWGPQDTVSLPSLLEGVAR